MNERWEFDAAAWAKEQLDKASSKAAKTPKKGVKASKKEKVRGGPSTKRLPRRKLPQRPAPKK